MSAITTASRGATHLRFVQHALLYTTKCIRVFLFQLMRFRPSSFTLASSPSIPSLLPSPPKDDDDFRALIPRGSWDSHMHVLDPRFPLDAAAPSIYGHDNACTLSALRALGGPDRARAVVAFDPAATPPETLAAWHRLGVRGVRLNLQSGGAAPPARAALEAALRAHAAAVRPLGWVLQIYASLPTIAQLEPLLADGAAQLGVRVCIDHMGHPDLAASRAFAQSGDPYALAGFASLVRLLEGGNAWVKLSAAYRFSAAPDGFSDAAPVAKELLRVAGRSRVVFATDWPHTRFEGLDIRPWIRTVLVDLCEKDEGAHREGL
ncbi:4-sulfomuconolactone hydrolase [Apiospora kogelbergensis]|uniref:4-sulfomuconolactone hydrolase n=1 Tax=Apiospora kogelbergensis TaxID=1337665 RepID=UPI00312EA8D0